MTHEQIDFINSQTNDIKRIMNVDNVKLTIDVDNDDVEEYIYTMSFVYQKHFHIDVQHVEEAAIYRVVITIPCLTEDKVFDLPLTHDGGILAVLMLIKNICAMADF